MKTCIVSGIAALMLAADVSAAVPEAQRKAELAERRKDMEAAPAPAGGVRCSLK